MIIWGARTYARVLATLMLVCQRCGNPAAHHVVQRTTKFTLFFIPLFPVSVRRSLTCTFCGTSTPIGKELAQQYVAQAGGQLAPNSGQPQYGQPPYQPQPYGEQPYGEQPQQYGQQ
jgi:zinc-ribbon family